MKFSIMYSFYFVSEAPCPFKQNNKKDDRHNFKFKSIDMNFQAFVVLSQVRAPLGIRLM